MYQRATLSNGIRILTSRMSHVRSVSIVFHFGVGSRYEPAESSGVSHFIEHMLFKGSERYPTAQIISETVEGVGGILDAETGKEVTVYSAKIASRHFDLATNLLADMVRFPRFDPAEIEKERRVIIEELNMYRDSPQDWVSVLGEEAFWPNLPLGREVAGTRETVESLTSETMQCYRASHYVPSNLVIAVVGDAEHEQVIETLSRLLGDWPAGVAPLWTPSEPPLDAPRVRLETRRTEQTNLCLYMPGLSRKDPDYYALGLLNAVLGDGMSSRLFLTVREQQGLAYDVSSGPLHYHDTGAFVVYAGVEPKRAQAAVRAILAELAKLRAEPVRADELSRAKEYT
ncbi:MAG TPA: pitrilysin family protein, partial [Ktedonobacterales bacterium]|nr:pitrilysin family protein [Ktedonobacterales bacterium]